MKYNEFLKEDEIFNLVNNEKNFNNLIKNINSIINFYNNNNMILDDYILISLKKTLIENISYLNINLEKYDYNFVLEGYVEYFEFINLLKESKNKLIKLDNNNILMKINNK